MALKVRVEERAKQAQSLKHLSDLRVIINHFDPAETINLSEDLYIIKITVNNPLGYKGGLSKQSMSQIASPLLNFFDEEITFKIEMTKKDENYWN